MVEIEPFRGKDKLEVGQAADHDSIRDVGALGLLRLLTASPQIQDRKHRGATNQHQPDPDRFELALSDPEDG
jgi:hypothetical protein